MKITNLLAFAVIAMACFCGCGKSTTIIGSVVDGKMKPLSGVKVVAKKIQPQKGYDQFETTTKADGSFNFNKLYPHSLYQIIIYPDNSTRNISIQTSSGFDGKELKLATPIICRFRFIEGASTVLDTQADLTWTINANIAQKTMNLSEANEWVKELTIDGSNNWRLPTKSELESISKYAVNVRPSDYLMSTGFNNVHADWYWTGSDEINGESTWGVHMGGGFVRGIANVANINVWPVRDLQNNM